VSRYAAVAHTLETAPATPSVSHDDDFGAGLENASEGVFRRQGRAYVRPDGHEAASRRAQFFRLLPFGDVPNEPGERLLTVVDDFEGECNRELLAVLAPADQLDG